MKNFHLDKPRWYYILFFTKNDKRILFLKEVLFFILKNDHSFKKIVQNKIEIRYEPSGFVNVFCGRKKLNKVLQEIDLLGLSDNAFIVNKEEKK